MDLNRLFFKSVFETNGRRLMSHHGGGFHPPTLDEMPKPVKSWSEFHAARQAKYNKHLVLGVGFFLFTLAVVKGSGLIYFNYSPPARPAPK